VKDYQEESYAEKVRPGGAGSILEVKRDKFEKTLSEYKKILLHPSEHKFLLLL
jgi:hypothetical protein